MLTFYYLYFSELLRNREMRIDVRITFQQQNLSELKKDQIPVRSTDGTVHAGYVSMKMQDAGVYLGTAIGDAGLKNTGKGKSLIELQQEAGNTDVGVMQDYMTLMSNTMSEEDYAKLQEEGFDLGSLSPEETVTIVDKIKAELLKAGVKIQGYTDDLDLETLTEALGSASLAKEVTESFANADIPLTRENMAAVETAHNLAQELKTPDEGTVHYLIDNNLELNLWNLFLAQNSGAATGNKQGKVPSFSTEQVKGYYIKNETVSDWKGLSEQIDKLIEKSGFEVNETNREYAKWMIENHLPLTKESMDLLTELKNVKIPFSEKDLAKSFATAVQEGKNPSFASVVKPTESIYEKAIRIAEYYHSEAVTEQNFTNLTARRQLEEIRLRMTAEVNVKLLKSGFSIDTAPMEKLLDALQQAEKELATSYFPKDENAIDKFRIYEKAQNVIREIPFLPVASLGHTAADIQKISTEEFYNVGNNLKQAYEKAGERYETLMTVPRSDLGDNIRKAFANVDDLLEDLGQSITEENRRAVRILGYNHMSIDVDNLVKVKEADYLVQSVVEKMKPAITLKMIRDGINPLEKSFMDLDEYLSGQEPEYHEEAESYSRFLYGLERRGNISDEERESFIGIYRLVHQIEKSEGAAIGSLINTQSVLNFANLLSAVRSGKLKHLDVRANDSLGLVSELVREGESISDQIGKAFAKEYDRTQMEAYRDAIASVSQEDITLLERSEFPANAENIMAAKAMMDKNSFLPRIGRKEKQREKLWEKLGTESFQEEYESILQETAKEAEGESFSSNQNSLDVRSLKLVYKQLTIALGVCKKHEYFLPMQVGEQMAKVHLTIQHSNEKSGVVDIAVMFTEKNKLQAEFYFDEGVLYGKLEKDTQDKVMNCEGIADNFVKEAEKIWKIGDIRTGSFDAGIANTKAGTDAEIDNQELYRVAKVFLAAVQNGEAYEN